MSLASNLTLPAWILLLLTGLLPAALLLAGLLVWGLALLARMLLPRMLLARVLVLTAHSGSPFLSVLNVAGRQLRNLMIVAKT
jgi:hypothetical protein